MDALTTTSTCAACGHGLPSLDSHEAGVETFRPAGDYWMIRFQGDACHVRDGKGLRYIAELLRAPGRELHALDLIANHAPEDECPHDDCEGDAYAAVERARLSVTRAIRRAQARIAASHPSLGRHLGTTLRTGTYCAYVPDSRVPITWDIG